MRLPAIPPGPAGRSGAPPLRIPGAAVAAAALLAPALLAALLPGLGAAWELDRTAVAAGELWRVVTCHWTHFTAEHLLWDGLALAFLGFLCWERSPRRTVAALAAATAAVPAAVLLWLPQMASYRGLSGVDSALYALLAGLLVRDALAARRPADVLLPALGLIGFAAKTAYELATGVSVFADSAAFSPVPLAHVVGAVLGTAAAFLPASLPRRRPGALV